MVLLSKANGNIVRTEDEKKIMIEQAAVHYGNFLYALGFDWEADENSKNTPHRYAKSFVEDLVAGSMMEEPIITAFPNGGYDGIVLQKDCRVTSLCSHHHREIVGKCHVAYIPGKHGLVIGLSKINRVVDFYSQRFQIQEGLTQQIHEHIDRVCEQNKGVAVIIEATHGCVRCRQLRDNSTMVTSKLSGYFFENTVGTRTELFGLLKL